MDDQSRDNARNQGAKNRLETEKCLVLAASQVFGERGYHRASVHEIAKRAGANVSLINRYFGGKRELFVAVVDAFIIEKQTAELGYPPQETLAQEIESYLVFRYKEDRKDSKAFRVILSELMIDEEFRATALKSLRYGADENFLARLHILSKAGKIRPEVDLERLFRMISLFSFSCWMIEGELLDTPSASTQELIEEFAGQIALGYAASHTGISQS